MQPELFQGRGGFVEPGTLINISLKKQKKKGPAWYSRYSYNYNSITLITTLITQRWIKSGSFSKKGRGGLPPPPSSCGPDAGGCWGEWPSIFSENPFFLRNWSLIKSKNISQTLCNKSIILCIYQNCSCMTHFVNVCKDDFY